MKQLYRKKVITIFLAIISLPLAYWCFLYYKFNQSESYFNNINERYYFGNSVYQRGILRSTRFNEELEILNKIRSPFFMNNKVQIHKLKVCEFYIDRCEIDMLSMKSQCPDISISQLERQKNDFCIKWELFFKFLKNNPEIKPKGEIVSEKFYDICTSKLNK